MFRHDEIVFPACRGDRDLGPVKIRTPGPDAMIDGEGG